MPVFSDSHMGIFMPADISERISRFIAGRLEFPYIRREELIAAFYLYGRNFGVQAGEVRDVEDMARKSVEQVARDVRLYRAMPEKLNPNLTRENYTKRSLQVAVDNADGGDISRRVAGDPAILSDCFAQHLAFYGQGYYFELFHPLKAGEVPPGLRDRLQGRMVLLGFGAKGRDGLPFQNVLAPFFEWLSAVG